ncbi:unnamed protein product [Moneuplotes crassus]|uniref:Uncharacterized protein n=1 Tax=Euplotes crassus TaxID=5936 RepID=A0AAD1YDD9_EUPCR|nr:unnamed protein product [Moneuplotes crassus]
MNIPSFCDENLSEDLIDENASVSSVNTSPNLEKNMSGSPFSRKSSLDKVFEPSSKDFTLPLVECAKEESSGNSKCRYCKKMGEIKRHTNRPPTHSSKLQSDIKGLLRQVIRMKSCLCEDKNQIGLKMQSQSGHACDEVVVTMQDIKSAEEALF